MAPTRRRNIRARAATASATPPTSQQGTSTQISKDPRGLRMSKREKRTAKHNTLMSKVRDSGATKVKKRRRAARKLPAAERLDELRDALPDFAEEGEWEGCSDSDTADGGAPSRVQRREGRIPMRSLKSKPGAMKRKHAMHQQEVERFGRNLAAMTGNAGGKGGQDAPPNVARQRARWNALRAFIGSTMEQDRAFRAG